MEQWEYWTVEIQETADRASVMKQALEEGGRFGYELVAVTPIVASTWDEQLLPMGGGMSSWRVRTMVLILTFKRRVPEGSAPEPT